MKSTAPQPISADRPVIIVAAIALLIAIVGFRFSGIVQDAIQALDYRFSLDYGEGIVWQQVLLMFTPRMYSPSPDLPFIVFHYPPLYHSIVKALLTLGWDPLFAGRLVSIISAVVCAASICALILLGARNTRNWGTRTWPIVALAVTIAIMFLCLNAIRTWGVLMRVDMLAETLGLVGTVVFVRSRSSTVGTTVALLFCVASVFTKQTQLPAGITIFAVAFLCDKRAALIAAVVAGSVGVAFAAALELKTGGFFKNIISYNVNPFTIHNAVAQALPERKSALFAVVMLVSLVSIASRFNRTGGWAELRLRDRSAIAEIVLAAHFVLACISSLEILKEGGATNYFIDLLATGSALAGLWLIELRAKPIILSGVIVYLALASATIHQRFLVSDELARVSALREPLVRQIAAADKPVISDDMVLVMRAGKSLVFEPAIIKSLIPLGKWDPAPLLAMIRDHGFAFALTYASDSMSGPLVTQAISAAYPREVLVDDYFTAHYPPAN